MATIGGDFTRNGEPVHDMVHRGQLNRGPKEGWVIDRRWDNRTTIQRGHDSLLNDAREYAGGFPLVLLDGEVQDASGACKHTGPDGAMCKRQPRQGVGITANGRRVILLEVDGHQRRSWGVTFGQMGRIFRAYGARTALAMDGGGSAVMWIRGDGLVSRPSYGYERKVSQALAIVP